VFATAPGGRVLAPILLGLSGLAWLTLAVWGQSPYGRYLDHQQLDGSGGALVLPVFLVGWLFMLLAMMLPTSLPVVSLFATMTRRRVDHHRLVLLLLTGYLGVWSVFGIAIHAFDAMLHALVRQSEGLAEHGWLIGPAVLVLAGAYQFTPLKYHCLDKCRSPLSFITERWRGRAERRSAFRLGVDHGAFCIGCCWSLMLVMFAVGVGSLGWMLGLGTVMAIEKNVSWGRRLSLPLGVVLVVAGVLSGLAGAREWR
jgi:predicted metal-binding membrane protein